MFSSTNPTKRSLFSALGPAAGIVAACLSLSSVAFADGGEECASATAAVVGANAFTTLGKTASATPPDDTLCTGTFLSWGTANPDVWFVYNAAGPGTLDLTTCLTGSYDTSMAVYSGTCAGLTEIACNGDDPLGDTGCQQYHSAIAGLSIAGAGNIYIRIGGYYDGAIYASGAGTLTLAFTAVTYGSCLTSTDPCGVVHAGNGCSDPTCCGNVCDTYPPCCTDATGWEQLCVDLAVDLCGIFIYSCTAPAYSNDCATAPMAVNDGDVKNFNTAGANTDGGPCDCNSGESDVLVHSDLWYSFVAPANGLAVISNCNTSAFDSKIALYAIPAGAIDGSILPSEFIACNEDCAEDAVNFTSTLSQAVNVGQRYLVRLGGYLGATGSGTISFNLPDPCVLPATGGNEGEGCGGDTNGGCVDAVTVTTTLPLNTAMAGTFWADADTRDVDTWKMTVLVPSTVTVEVWSASNTVLNLLSGDMCGTLQLLANGTGACPMSYSICLNPGVYYVQTAINGFTGSPCGSGAFNNYVIKASTVPATCPVLLGTACVNPGPDNKTINTDNTTNAGFTQCGVAGVTGYSVDSQFARVFAAATVNAGQIHCVNFGIACYKYTSATTIIASDLPQSGSLSLYYDSNGGAPVNTAGATADLTLITTIPFSAPGGFYAAAITLDTPICLTGNAKNVVVVAHLNEVVPNNLGYRLAVAGSLNGPANTTYVMFPACGAAYNDFNLFASTRSWYVNLNGNFTSCGSTCPWDFNNDGNVDGADLGSLLGAWGPCTCPQDLNNDGNVDGADLGAVLGAWGPCP